MSGKRGADAQVQDVKVKKPRNDAASIVSTTQLALIQKSKIVKTEPQAVQDFVRGLGPAVSVHPPTGPTQSWADIAAGDPQLAQLADFLDVAMATPQWSPPPVTSHPFTRFDAYMLPPCLDLAFELRSDLDKLRAFAAASRGTDKSTLDHAKNELANAIEQYTNTVTPTLQAWVDAAFSSLGLPARSSTGPGYHDDLLHIVLIPEFAFNGRIENGTIIYGAEYPLPEAVEGKLTEIIHAKLQAEYPHLRVICAFSIASYLDMLFTFDSSGVDKIASANRMTVLTSTSKPFMRVTKFSPSNTDGWKNDVASGLVFMDTNTIVRPADDATGLARLTEIKLDLNCFGEQGKSLAFGTCLDAISDNKHGEVNLVVILGCGCPIGQIADQQHPFILNDIFSWKLEWDAANQVNTYRVDRNSFFGVGLYDCYATRPSTLPAEVKDVKTLGNQYSILGVNTWTTSAHCYYRSDLVNERPFAHKGNIAYLAPMPFPSTTATAV